MLLHPGRLRTAEAEPLVRVSIVSMLVVANLPAEIVVTAHVTHHPSVPGEEEPPITLRFRREEFTQQGPSGPIESKKTFTLRLPQLGQSAGASLVCALRAARGGRAGARLLRHPTRAPHREGPASREELAAQRRGHMTTPRTASAAARAGAWLCSCGCGRSPRSPVFRPQAQITRESATLASRHAPSNHKISVDFSRRTSKTRGAVGSFSKKLCARVCVRVCVRVLYQYALSSIIRHSDSLFFYYSSN